HQCGRLAHPRAWGGPRLPAPRALGAGNRGRGGRPGRNPEGRGLGPPFLPAPVMATETRSGGKSANRLSKETSPYLLQHQYNPVDWYPWGEEAFARAKAEGKPVLLSV